MDVERLTEANLLEEQFTDMEEERKPLSGPIAKSKLGSVDRAEALKDFELATKDITPVKDRWKELRNQYDSGDLKIQREINNIRQKLRTDEIMALISVLQALFPSAPS